MYYRGLIRNFTDVIWDPFLADSNLPILTSGTGVSSISGIEGTIYYYKNLICTSSYELDPDTNNDGRLIFSDEQSIRGRYGNVTGQSTYVLEDDISCEGKIQVRDLTRVGFDWHREGEA